MNHQPSRGCLTNCSYPRDPADRVIGATALIHDIPLLTADRDIRKSRAVPTLW